MQDASLYVHGLDPIELIFGLFAIPGRDQMLGFVQKHRAQSQSPKFFLIHITHFRVIGVPGGCLASSSLFLDEMFSSSYIHFDVPIKGQIDCEEATGVGIDEKRGPWSAQWLAQTRK